MHIFISLSNPEPRYSIFLRAQGLLGIWIYFQDTLTKVSAESLGRRAGIVPVPPGGIPRHGDAGKADEDDRGPVDILDGDGDICRHAK